MEKKTAPKKSAKRNFKVAKVTTIEKHLEAFKTMHEAAAADGSPAGACLVSDPQTGQSQCIRTDQATCKALKGVFIGGPCGG
jgi:hypothetical protein